MTASSRLVRRHALLERSDELAVVDAVLAGSLTGAGQFVVIEGSAGIGKSAMLEETRSRAAESDLSVLHARGGELERSFAYGVVRQLFEPVIARADEGERKVLLGGAAALAARLFAGTEADGELFSSEDDVYALLHGLYWLTVNLSELRPLLLAIDDLHWVDPASLRSLSYIVRRLEGVNVCVVTALRPLLGEEEPFLAELLSGTSATVVRPKPLTLSAVTGLIRDRLATEADADFCAACHRATGGNPLLLRELLRTLDAENVPPTAAAIDRIERVAPDSVSRSVSWRLARLPAGAVSLARALAILGDGASDQSVAVLSGVELRALPAAAAALARVELLQPTQPLRFVHPLVRNAVYAVMPTDQRAEEHARAAAVLRSSAAPLEALAAQLLLAPPSSVDGSAGLLREAARKAAGEGARESAARYLARALEEPLTDELRSEILFELAAAEFSVGSTTVVARLNEAIKLARDPTLRALGYVELGRALSWSRKDEDVVAAVEMLEKALAEHGDPDDDLGRRLEAELLANAIKVSSLQEQARKRLAGVAVGASEGPGARMLLGMRAYAEANRGANRDLAVDLAREALSAMPEQETALSIRSAVDVLLQADQFEEGLRVIDILLAEARRRGPVFTFAGILVQRVLFGLAGGKLVEAEADARMALDALPHRDLFLMPHAHGRLAHVLVERGAVEEAAAVLAEAEAVVGPIPERFSHVSLLRARSVLAGINGDHRRALSDALAIGRIVEAVGDHNPLSSFPGWRSTAALAHRALGATSEAHELARQEVALAEAWGAPRGLGRALRIRGLIEGGTKGIESLAEAVGVLEGSPARLEYAYALADLGAALRRANRRSAARGHLREALELAQRCGALLLAERAHTELVASGGRPRRPMLSGIDALTPSERRIVRMAAEGLANREIAQELFVTRRTVEMHLSNAFRKLGVSSRTQLPAALATRSTPAKTP
jgi:DNA-binding CsgD family transcriptional regulator